MSHDLPLFFCRGAKGFFKVNMILDKSKARAALLSRKIKEWAQGLGFHKVGIVRAEALHEERTRLEEWLGRGFHGEMRWMARDPRERTDPRLLFPQARSVVVVALNYYTPHEHAPVQDASSHDNATGKISRYSWGD